MGKSLTTEKPKFRRKSLVTKEEERNIKKEKMIFSFFHFKEIKNFEIGNCSSKWYFSLLKRLSVLESMTSEQLLEDNRSGKALRCHPINWSMKNVPIKRTDLIWLPKEILENEAEVPIMQLSISTGTGRIIGYLDKNSSVFYIILLDPNHNIQPCKKDNWQIQPTKKGFSQYDDLLTKIDSIYEFIKKCPHSSECEIPSKIEEINTENNIIYTILDDEFYLNYQEQLEKYTLQEIVESGILYLME